MKAKNPQINIIKEKLVTTMQAMVEDGSLLVDFDEDQENNFFAWNQNLITQSKIARLPDVRIDDVRESDFGVFEDSSQFNKGLVKSRSCADLAASYLMFHDFEIQEGLECADDEKKFFDEFEKVRVVSQIKDSYLGAAKNILAKVEEDIFSGSTNLSLVLLKEVFPNEILPRTKVAADDLEKNLNKNVVSEIKNLAKKSSDQSAFFAGVEKILQMLKDEENNEENNDEGEGGSENEKQDLKNDLTSFGQESVEANEQENPAQGDQEDGGVKEVQEDAKTSDLELDDNDEGEVSIKNDVVSDKEGGIEFKNAYKVFTSKFDEIVFPEKLTSKNDLELLRDQLDLKMSKLGSISKKMSLKLKRKLMAKRSSFIQRDSSSGILDKKKLTQFVLDPFMEEIWTNKREDEYQNTCLTILLDNSGSMRGNPIVMSAMACEIIAEILEKFAVKTEIIGFTTADWKGGRARKMWESSGRVKNPGRLNELRHIIYKHFNQKFKKAKTNLGLMLKEGVLKENIDGEALLFARSRLMQQSEKRKILIVISDGMPIDDSTNSANDNVGGSDILSDHLEHVINKIEKRSEIEVVGIGIGHSTEGFYKNSISIKSLDELGDVMIEKIVDLL